MGRLRNHAPVANLVSDRFSITGLDSASMPHDRSVGPVIRTLWMGFGLLATKRCVDQTIFPLVHHVRLPPSVRRSEFASKPTRHLRFVRIGCNDVYLDVIALVSGGSITGSCRWRAVIRSVCRSAPPRRWSILLTHGNFVI
jgi:hypothetical protein